MDAGISRGNIWGGNEHQQIYVTPVGGYISEFGAENGEFGDLKKNANQKNADK